MDSIDSTILTHCANDFRPLKPLLRRCLKGRSIDPCCHAMGLEEVGQTPLRDGEKQLLKLLANEGVTQSLQGAGTEEEKENHP